MSCGTNLSVGNLVFFYRPLLPTLSLSFLSVPYRSEHCRCWLHPTNNGGAPMLPTFLSLSSRAAVAAAGSSPTHGWFLSLAVYGGGSSTSGGGDGGGSLVRWSSNLPWEVGSLPELQRDCPYPRPSTSICAWQRSIRQGRCSIRWRLRSI